MNQPQFFVGLWNHPFVAFHRKMLRQKKLGAIGGIVFALFLFAGVFADVLAPMGINETDMRQQQKEINQRKKLVKGCLCFTITDQKI